MITTCPHRKRRANKGRFDTAVVVTSGYRRVNDAERALVWDADVCRDTTAGRHKEVDAIIDERTFHRNRFNADHRVVVRAQNLPFIKDFIGRLSAMGDMKVTREYGNVLCAKILTNADAVLKAIHASRFSGLFQVEEGFVNR